MQTEKFIMWLKTNGKRDETIRQYVIMLSRVEKAVGEIDAQKAEAINKKLHLSGFSPKVLALATSVVRKYLKFSGRKLEIARIEKPEKYKSPQKKIFLLPNQVRELERACKNDRELLIIRLLLMTGIRRAILANLTVAQASEDKISIPATALGNKGGERYLTIELPESTKMLIKKVAANDKIFDNRLLFSGLSENFAGRTEKQRAETFTSKVIAIGKRAKMHLTPHVLRHTFGTYHFNKFKDIMRLRDLLGQHTVSATERYVHSSRALDMELGKSDEKKIWLEFTESLSS